MTSKITLTILMGLCVAAITTSSGCGNGTAMLFTHSRWLFAIDGIVVVSTKLDPEKQDDDVATDAVFLTEIRGDATA